MHGTRATDQQNSRKGFTLLEMSIVLIIIGLIVGGILIGRTLIRQTQINSVMAQAQSYIAAVATFQKVYQALPGDMGNATSFWGAMSSCPEPAGTAAQGGTLTCNGDNNGQISILNFITPTNIAEQFYFWQHLSNAQLITGSYSGIAGSLGVGQPVIGGNSPASRVPGLGFTIAYKGIMSGDPNFFDGTYRHVFLLGAADTQGNDKAILTPIEAENFDTKFDDGLPATGNLRTFKQGGGVSNNCATTNVSTTALYNTAAGSYSNGPQCSFVMILGF